MKSSTKVNFAAVVNQLILFRFNGKTFSDLIDFNKT